jgi:hypothetical protein
MARGFDSQKKSCWKANKKSMARPYRRVYSSLYIMSRALMASNKNDERDSECRK